MKFEPLLILLISLSFNSTFVVVRSIYTESKSGVNCDDCIDYRTPESRIVYEDENAIFTKSGDYILKGGFSSISYRNF